MHILIADKLSDQCVERLESAGHQVTIRPELKDDDLVSAMSDLKPQILVVRSTKVSAGMMDAARSLELIVRAGAGYDTIDSDGASERGIFLANCPGKNAAAVAELTIGLILSLDRSIPDNVSDARKGEWNKAKYGKAHGVKGKTLGIVGLGSIGREVVQRARALEMHIVAWSRSLTDSKADALGVERLASPIEVARRSDVVSLHVASAPETRNLADTAFFEAMRPGAFFINTTRSNVVDDEALLRAMDEKGIRAALDVFSGEPAFKQGPFSHPLASRSDVYLTHHIGASTLQAQEAIAEEAVRLILAYAKTGQVANCVNMAETTPATHQLTVRHLDKVGVLASVLDEIRNADWNIQEMENLVFSGARAACATIRFNGSPDSSVLHRISGLDDVLAINIIDL